MNTRNTTNTSQTGLQSFADAQESSQPVLEAVHLRKDFPISQFRLLRTPQAVHAVEDASLAKRLH